MTTFPQPTEAAIADAVNKANLQGHLYNVEPIGDGANTIWGYCTVQNTLNSKRVYAVDISENRPATMPGCSCPQWARAGVCKHEKMAADWYAEQAAPSEWDFEEGENMQIEATIR